MSTTTLLVGLPNAGKSTLFNALTGKNSKVCNYPGVTVQTHIAPMLSDDGENNTLVDPPGIYNFVPKSIDEGICISTLMGCNPDVGKIDSAVLVFDLDRIESGISLALQMKALFGTNFSIVINKCDMPSQGLNDNLKTLSEKLALPIMAYSERSSELKQLKTFIGQNAKADFSTHTPIEFSETAFKFFPFKLREHSFLIKQESAIIANLASFQQHARELAKIISEGALSSRYALTQKIDSVLTHPILGSIFFIAIFYAIFHSIYTFAAPFMDMIDGGFGAAGEWVGQHLSNGLIKGLIVDGIIAGVGGVVIFLPQICILFLLFSLLEQSGYIARAAFLCDRVLSKFGLNGRAFLPFLSGFACAIPGMMATRTIADRNERMAALFVLPFFTCSARIPVYALLIGTFVPEKTILGVFDSRALCFFFMYFLGTITALIVAKILRITAFSGKTTSFFMEMPIYQRPSIKQAITQSASKGLSFLQKAGTVILVLSMIIWFLGVFPAPDKALLVGKTDNEISAITLEHSTLGTIGKTIEPLIKPIGYDWKMGVGILVAFGARELFVSSMATIYSLGDANEESSSLKQRLLNEIDPETGKPVYNLAVVASLLVFFAYALQCISTLAIVKRETNHWRHAVYMFFFMGALAYGGAFIVYRSFLPYVT